MLHCGAVARAELTEKPVSWIPLEEMLPAGRFDAEDEADVTAIVEREAGAGKTYAILTVRIAKGRSMGRHDYQLVCRGECCPCLALSRDGIVFDPRLWCIEPGGEPTEARALFEVPSGAGEAAVTFALPVTLQMPAVTVSFGGALGARDARPVGGDSADAGAVAEPSEERGEVKAEREKERVTPERPKPTPAIEPEEEETEEPAAEKKAAKKKQQDKAPDAGNDWF